MHARYTSLYVEICQLNGSGFGIRDTEADHNLPIAPLHRGLSFNFTINDMVIGEQVFMNSISLGQRLRNLPRQWVLSNGWHACLNSGLRYPNCTRPGIRYRSHMETQPPKKRTHPRVNSPYRIKIPVGKN